MAGKIFINYRRDDSAAEALNVAQYLENRFGKSSIFIDIDRLRAGQKFATVLEDKLGQCKVMLAIIGPNWIDARDEKSGTRRLDNPEDWVRLEIERSLARNIPVIPVLVAGATLPSKSELPPSLQPLIGYQYATVTTNGFRHEMAGLARDVTELTVRRLRGRMAAAVSALILGGYVAAYQFGAPVWWPSFGQAQPNVVEAPKPNGKPETAPKGNPDAAEAEPGRKVEAARDPGPSVTPRSGEIFRDRLADGNPCLMCPEMVVAPAGSFMMGSAPSEIAALTLEFLNDAAWWKTEGPQHKVTIPHPLAIGRYAVTFAEWDACVADGGCNGYEPRDRGWGRGKLPVINVKWYDAQAYAAWLTRKTGKPYRLLSEAEREYATRARTTTAFSWGPSISTSQANYNGNYTFAGGAKGVYREKTVPVDSFAPNPWELYNVHGNVREWVEDCWHDGYQGAPSDGSAWTTACTDGGRRVVRGGCWSDHPQFLRSADRDRGMADLPYNDIGFRLARTLNP
jgi:formylglycine-generating enzyme required for sulfatase activity